MVKVCVCYTSVIYTFVYVTVVFVLIPGYVVVFTHMLFVYRNNVHVYKSMLYTKTSRKLILYKQGLQLLILLSIRLCVC